MGVSANKGSAQGRMVLAEINVTPLVDVMLVLLIMFMVTAPLLQQGIEVEVPQTKGGGVEIQEEPLRLIVTANKRISIAKSAISLEALGPKLSAILKEKKNKQVFIEADHRVDYGFVAQIMSEVKIAGATSLGLITQPPQ
jgi:biopolymer transport protein TolR